METTAYRIKKYRIKFFSQLHEESASKLAYIDALRGIAILLVILVHTSQSVEGLSPKLKLIANFGQMGVQLFFILSSITLCTSMDRRKETTLKNFYVRRYFRIAPMYYFGILIYFVVTWLRLKSVAFDIYNFKYVGANIFFVHGFYREANNTIVPGGWSIGCEIAFYAAFPFIFKAIKKISNTALLAAVPFIAFVFVFIIEHQIYKSVENNTVKYYFIFNQLPTFILGVCFYQLNSINKLTNQFLNGVISCALFAASIYMFKINIDFSIVPFITGLAFVFLVPLVKACFSNSYLQKIGKQSFSMYVLHFLFAWYLSKKIASFLYHLLPPAVIFVLCYLFSVLLAYLCAKITEKFIEKPGMELGRKMLLNNQPVSS